MALKPSEFLKDGNFMLILIPILAGVTAWLTGYVSQKLSPTMATDPSSAGSMKMMNIVMPLISVWISYTYTSALGLYWIASNIVAIGQTFLLNKLYSPKKVLAEVEDKMRKEKEEGKAQTCCGAPCALQQQKQQEKARCQRTERSTA